MKQFALIHHNPLRNLDEARLIAILEAGERGEYAETQWLFRFIEKRDPIGRAVKSRLLAAIGKLDWQINAPDCADDEQRQAMADAQAATLRAEYDQIENMADALSFMALAELRGFAHLEKIYAGGEAEQAGPGKGDPWTIKELRIVEQWFWVRDGIYGAWNYNEDARIGIRRGTEIDPARFVIREVDGPIGEIMAKLYVRKDNSDADWDGALQTFGVPPTIIEMPPNISPEKEKEYQRQAENIASGAKGTIPAGAKVHTVNPLSGNGVFRERLDYLEAQLVIAATGGKLTILTESGSGTLAGSAQADAFDDLADAIAMRISGAFNAQLDREILARKHASEPALAYFQLSRTTEKDGSKALTDAKLAKDAGYALDADELQERSGYKLTTIGAEDGTAKQQSGEGKAGNTPPVPLSPAAPAASSPFAPSLLRGENLPQTPDDLQQATAAQLGVSADFLAPAAQEFGTLIAEITAGDLTPDALLASAQAMLDQVPGLSEKMDATGIAAALTQATRKAVAKTLQA